jgi:three-Cys-motif partner protein
MVDNESFFEAPQAAAVYKHKLLKSYVPVWTGKVGSTSQGNRVVVYDAYSGPGRYDSQDPGSPELLVDTASALADKRTIHTVFSDKEPSYCAQLNTLLAQKGIDPQTYEVRHGPVEDHLDSVLALAGDLPLLVFLDPYGVTVPHDRLVHLLNVRMKPGLPQTLQPKTELLMNFSYEAVRRIAGALRSQKEYKAKAAQIQTLDDALGGDWWQPIALSEAEGWIKEVLLGFASRLAAAAHCGYITADVADSLTAQPVYELILFTRHRDGLWEMADAMSYAYRDWRIWLNDRLKEKREVSLGGQVELDFGAVEVDEDEAVWAAEIARNVEQLLTTSLGFVVNDRLGDVLGKSLGIAREMHIRKALKSLYSRGIISREPKGPLKNFYIARK